MTESLRFDGKVVIITGAGGGLGREYALLFASRGAKVVVNDLGGNVGGAGEDKRAADKVVSEIEKAGGVAVANYDNVVTNANGIIQTAVEAFGSVHVVINNAGILRDAQFAKMTDAQFAALIDVHLTGAFRLTHAAWPFFKKQNYGRVINTCSPAGLYGNFGQANYSAAKLALVGFAETLAKEGYKNNIRVNVIAPLARSRMTEGIVPEEVLQKLSPEKIAPLVAYLSHESVPVTGSIFEVAAGFFSQIRWERSGGAYFKPNSSFTPEAILHNWKEVVSFDKPTHPTQLNDYVAVIKKTRAIPKDNQQGSKKIDSLKGKVVIITGAGTGIGRNHALWFAKYGAKVVVNDFQDPFTLVEEIEKNGGVAVASKHDVVSQGDKIVETAVEKFGRIDILVNNAGVLRDKSFLKMSEDEWKLVLSIHLVATYKLCSLCWPIFVKQGSGRIVNTTSTSGIYGNFGQANYAAAKAGVLGLSRTLAIEGKKRGIKVNVIAPHAETAMTKTIFKQEELNLFHPDQVSPLVVLLASDELDVTGQLFEVGGGWIARTRWQRAKGAVCHDAKPSIEFLKDNWKLITDFSEGTLNPESTQEATFSILEAVGGDDEEEEGDEDEDDDEEEEEETSKSDAFKYTHRDVIVYNLGLGAKATELKYTYEGASDFQVLPSFGVIPSFVQDDGGVDMEHLLKNFNPMMLLHGEQYLKIHKFPIPTEAEVETKAYPIAVLNKGSKAALIVAGYDTVDKNTGEHLFHNEGSYFIRGAQGVKGSENFKERTSFAVSSFEPLKRECDFQTEYKTSPDQAAIYRLSGDYNPLHIDPSFAKGAKFDKPILHGLCTFGCAAKVLYEKFGPFSEVKLRFTSIVYPGETLVVKAWKQKSDMIVWDVFSKERNCAVISNAALRLLGDSAKL